MRKLTPQEKSNVIERLIDELQTRRISIEKYLQIQSSGEVEEVRSLPYKIDWPEGTLAVSGGGIIMEWSEYSPLGDGEKWNVISVGLEAILKRQPHTYDAPMMSAELAAEHIVECVVAWLENLEIGDRREARARAGYALFGYWQIDHEREAIGHLKLASRVIEAELVRMQRRAARGIWEGARLEVVKGAMQAVTCGLSLMEAATGMHPAGGGKPEESESLTTTRAEPSPS